MQRSIQTEVRRFERIIGKLRGNFAIEEVCSHAYIFVPKKRPLQPIPPKSVGLTLAALIHGNESVGIAVLNEFLALLASGTIDVTIPLGIVLGNPDAADKNERFLESDLNRSFGLGSTDTLEGRRAKELEPLLDQTAWLLDMHQTRLATKWPFFIFPYRLTAFEFAENLSARTAIVTHWGGGFSTEGLCSDEYVNTQGGVGLTVECGQAGFDPLQVGFGLKLILHAIRYVTHCIDGQTLPHPHAQSANRQLFTMAATIACPQSGALNLRKSLVNFQRVSKGEELAQHAGQALLSPIDGWLLFPNYTTEIAPEGARPKELMRVLKSIRYEDLPAT